MRPFAINNDVEAEAVKRLEVAIEKIADETPAWLWDRTGLAEIYEDIDRLLLLWDREKVSS
jgi:hypothetical protein